mgnify:CR=1 FL=1
MKRDIHARIKPDQALEELKRVRQHLASNLRHRLCLQDTQNVLCEFDKYERARLGQGRPKQRY